MKNSQSGFTLIELVMVIVILGVLSAVALPKFVDLKSDAAQAAINGAAGAVNSAMAINYATFNANSSKAIRLSGAAALASMTAGGALTGWDATKFVIATDGTCAAVAGATVVATLRSADDTTKTATATIICTG